MFMIRNTSITVITEKNIPSRNRSMSCIRLMNIMRRIWGSLYYRSWIGTSISKRSASSSLMTGSRKRPRMRSSSWLENSDGALPIWILRSRRNSWKKPMRRSSGAITRRISNCLCWMNCRRMWRRSFTWIPILSFAARWMRSPNLISPAMRWPWSLPFTITNTGQKLGSRKNT